MRSILILLLLAAPAWGDITVYTTTGQSLYVRFNDASDTAVDLTEGSSLEVGEYVAADSAIVTAGLGAGSYSGRVFVGTAAGQANTDAQVGIVEQFVFDGTNEVDQQGDVFTRVLLALPAVAPGAAGGLPKSATGLNYDTLYGFASTASSQSSSAATESGQANAKLGAITGSGDNTLLGLILALLKSDAPTPSDIGGTYDPSTDSQEAQQAAIAAVDLASATTVSQVPVAKDLTFICKRTNAGLVGELERGFDVGEVVTIAVDFRNDLATNGRLVGTPSFAIKSGTAGGVTFDNDNAGVDKSQAKVEMTCVTAGTYVFTATATKSAADGGGTVKADLTGVLND